MEEIIEMQNFKSQKNVQYLESSDLLFCFAKQECGVSEPKYLVQSEFIRIVQHNHATHATAATL